MTTLTEKFTILENQLSDQHDILIARIDNISQKLSWDNGEDTFSSAQLQYLALLQLQAIKDSNDSLVTLLSGLYDRTVDQINISDRIDTSTSATAGFVENISNNLGGAIDSEHTVTGLLNTIEELLSDLRAVVGVPGDATETIVSQLHALANCACRPDGAQPPLDAACEHPFSSCSIAFIPWIIVGGTNVNVAKWCEPLAPGLEFGTTLGLSDDTTELVPTTSWEGWQIFVSSASTVFGKSPLDLERFPTNTWLPLHGTDAISIATDERNSLKVYLCGPEGTAPDVCTALESVSVTAPWGASFQAISWAGTGLPCVNTGPTGTFSECIFSTSDLTEWTVETSDSNVYINQSGLDGSTERQLLVPDEAVTLPGPTPYFHIYSSEPFSVIICPPAE